MSALALQQASKQQPLEVRSCTGGSVAITPGASQHGVEAASCF